MFKLIKVDFYDEFACMMGKCPDNCCDEDWDIYVDDETIEKYRQLGIPDLDSKISVSEPHVIIKKDHKCPFITPEGLCTFHRDFGEEYLSNTCRSYPRFVSTYGDVYLETLGPSCPATVKHVIETTDPIVFVEKMYYEDQSEIGRILDTTEYEMTARNLISRYIPSKSVIKIYKELITEMSDGQEPVIDTDSMLTLLRQQTAGTPSDRYVREVFGEENGCDQYIAETEKSINSVSEMFSCNINRIWLFEHIMLESKNEKPDITSVIRRGFIMWTLLLTALKNAERTGRLIDTQCLTDCTYKLMRIIDHGDRLLLVLNEGILH